VDVEVDIVYGSFHEVDSSEIAFKMASIFAMKDGFRQGKPILLEPIMKVENITPEEYRVIFAATESAAAARSISIGPA